MTLNTVGPQASDDEVVPPAWVRWSGFVIGPCAAIVVWAMLRDDVNTTETNAALSREGAIVLALMVWMACWWLTQAVELATTALLPLLVFPMCGVLPMTDAAEPYASDIIFLFAGGCLLAMALEKHDLSRRFAQWLLALAGPRPVMIVGAFMLTAALVSAFVSNTATAAMMMPLALAAAAHAWRTAPEQPERARRIGVFAVAVLLGVAYGANIGGAMTLIGSPPNAIAAKLLRNGGIDVTFLSWLSFSLPVALLFLPIGWILLSRVLLPVGRLRLAAISDSQERGTPEPPLSRAGYFTLVVFLVTVTLWITLRWLPSTLSALQDAGVAVLAGVALLIVPLSRDPSSTTLSWRDASRLPWSVFVLFGGGLAVAAAMTEHGVALWLSQAFHALHGAPEIVVIGGVVLAVLFMTELASNTALAATAIPVLMALAPALGMPVERLVIPAAFAASWAFMLPVGTPPNALVFATGQIPAMTMARVGFVLNLVAAAIITLGAAMLL